VERDVTSTHGDHAEEKSMSIQPVAKARRSLVTIGVGALVVVAALVLVVVLSIDFTAARVISSEGTSVLGAKTSVGGAHIALLGGTSSVSGLRVAQPEGFGEGDMLSLDRTAVTVRLPALIGERIEIDEVALTGLAVAVVSKDGTINLQKVADNVQKSMSSTEAEPAPAEVKPGKEVLIRKLVVRDIDVTATGMGMTVTGNPVKIRIPDITLDNVSSANAQDSLTSEITSQVLQSVVAGVLKSNVEGLSDTALAGLNSAGTTLNTAIEQFSETAKVAAAKLSEGLKGATKDLEGAGEKAKEGVGELGKDLKGIFGGKNGPAGSSN
jgi:flagellar hook-basal body complex protein FliE